MVVNQASPMAKRWIMVIQARPIARNRWCIVRWSDIALFASLENVHHAADQKYNIFLWVQLIPNGEFGGTRRTFGKVFIFKKSQGP